MNGSNPEIYVVATPIGNLEDITYRAVRILKECDIVAAEDTRNTGKLLSKLEISKKMISMHEHNEKEKADYLIDLAFQGKKIAVVSDAGTPLISDPGFRLVEKGVERGIRFVPVPGVSALTTLVCVAGLATDRFSFFGFIPRKASARERVYGDVELSVCPVIFYESPKRIIKTLGEMLEKIGDRKVSLGRELTKMHEEIIRGSLSEVIAKLEAKEAVKGEICFAVEGGAVKEEKEVDILEIVKSRLETDDEKPKVLSKKIAEEYGFGNKEIYEIILKLKGKK